MSEMFSKMQQNEWKRELEPSQPVHHLWIELTINSNVQWQPPWLHCYEDLNAGPCVGPTQYIKDVIRTATNLSAVFIGILPLTFLSKVAEMTEEYSYKDWVVEQRRKDEDGNEIRRRYFVDVPEGMEGACHHTKKQQYKICPGFITM
jgi:hypothetical protein